MPLVVVAAEGINVISIWVPRLDLQKVLHEWQVIQDGPFAKAIVIYNPNLTIYMFFLGNSMNILCRENLEV